MFEQAFKNIDDVLWKEAGCTTELDYTEQTSWLLFLKYLDGLEQDKADEAALERKKYNFILDKQYRWEEWAAPKGQDGQIDHNKAMTGDDLVNFVNQRLFPYLHGFKQKATGPNTIEYKIGEIFGEIKNKISSGYNLRGIIDHIDELRFRSQTEKHELSHLYEAKIRNMGNAGRNGGEYYTPRPLIRAMVQVIQPKIGETIYDGACGSAGFLCESFDYLKSTKNLTTRDVRILQERTFTGKEKKSLAYVIAIMNMILHGIDVPNIAHTNTLTENAADIQEKDRVDVVLANPPFGGKERKEVQQNFSIRTGETAFLFLQHFIKMLRAGGRGGVVIKNTFLSNTDNASVSLRKLLLESCNLYTVLDCPGGVFQGAGVKTVVLFFEKGTKTRKIWFYQLDSGRNLGKTNPLNDADLAEFVTLQKTFADSPKSWSVDAKSLDPVTFDLSVKNPNGGEAVAHRSPQEILDEIAALDAESAEVLETIRGVAVKAGWEFKRLDEVCEIVMGQSPDGDSYNVTGHGMPLINGPVEFSQGPFGRTIRSKFTTEPTKLCKENDLILCVRGSTTGRMNIAGFDACIGRGVAAIRAKQYQPWINHFIQSKRDDIHALGTGSTFPNVSSSILERFVVPVPPVPEQRRIVGILDEAFGGLATAKANAEKNPQNARAVLESHLDAVVTHRGQGWVEKKLGDVCAIVSTLVDPRHGPFLDMPHVGAGNIESKSGVLFDLKTAREEGLISGKFAFDESVVLYSKIRPYLMKVARPDFKGLCSADIYPLAPRPTQIARDYLFHLLLSTPFTDYAIQGSARAGMPKVNRDHLFEFRVWLPGLETQRKLASNLDLHAHQTRCLESIYQKKTEALDALKKSLLHQAFSGQL